MLDATRLTDLFGILQTLHTLHDPVALWRMVLEKSCAALDAEGGSFFVVEADGRLMLTAASGVDEEALRRVPLRVGMGVCGWAAEQRQTVVIQDAQNDSRFNPMADQVTGNVTRSILCIPIVSEDRTHGVLEVINSRRGTFSESDLSFMALLAQQTAIAYQNLTLVREMAKTNTLLQSLLLNMSGGLIAIDADKNLTVLNPAARRLLELPSNVGVGQPAAAVLMHHLTLLDPLYRALSNKSTVTRQETMLSVGGKPARFGYSTILIADATQAVLGSAILFQRLF